MESPPPFSLNLVLGPILLGSLFGWGLFGVLCLQTYLYYRWYPKDEMVIKVLVAGLFALELIDAAVSTHAAWFFLVAGWGNPQAALGSPWSICATIILTGIIAVVSQLFFASRLWHLSGSLIIVSGIFLVALAQCACAIVGAFQVLFVKVANSTKLSTFDSLSIWLGLSAGCDIAIAVGMVYFLLATRTRSGIKATEFLITRLIDFSIRTGIFTALCAIISLVFFLTLKETDMQDLPFLMLAKLYSNAVLANINARASLLQGSLNIPSSESARDVSFAGDLANAGRNSDTARPTTQTGTQVSLAGNKSPGGLSDTQIFNV